MKSCKYFILVLILFVYVYIPVYPQNKSFDDNYSGRVLNHITEITKFGTRQIGSPGAVLTAGYIKSQFKKAGLDATVEPFYSYHYKLNSIKFTSGNKDWKVEFMGFDPYKEKFDFSGKYILLDALQEKDIAQIAGKVVIAGTSSNFFQLMMLKPMAVLFFSNADLEEIKKNNDTSFTLHIEGKLEKIKNANIIGILPSAVKTDKEIIITAHYDSYQSSPAANDNGTGIGTLIELAKIFSSQNENKTANIKFIALDGEESGMLGARMYVKSHLEDLKNCLLVFNIDTIGGEGALTVETVGGESKEIAKGKNNVPDYLTDKILEGLDGSWRIISPEIMNCLMASNNPGWLKKFFDEAALEEKIEITHGKNFFSDQRMFAQAGIPETGIAQKTGSKILHSVNDNIERIKSEMIKNGGAICYSVIIKVMRMK